MTHGKQVKQKMDSTMQQAYQLLTTSPVLGCYNCCEITTAFLIDKKCKITRNYYTICVLEERCSVSGERRFLTSKPIFIGDDLSLGIEQRVVSLEECGQAFAQLFTHIQDGCVDIGSGKLCIGAMEAVPPVFVPPDSTLEIPLNRVLKNNFLNGSYVLEFFDAQKTFFASLPKPQKELLADKLAEYLPIDLFTIADRVGSILFQFPSLNVRYRYQVRNEETAFHHSLTLDPRIPDVSHILVTSELIQDENIVGRSDFLCDGWQVEKEIAVGDASRLCRTTIVDLQTHLVLSSQSTSLMREMTGFCHLSDPFSEPRTIWDSEKKQCTKVQITSQETIHVDPNHVLLRDKLIENRQYAEKVKTLEKRLEFCQYKPGQRPRALADLRTLMNRGHDGMVYLWDPYLSVDDLLETWYYTTVFGMKLHAITSKSASGKEEVPAWIQEQRQRIQSRSNNRGISLELRCQWGTHGYGFHDRFLMIVREHKTPEVWSLGTSVNSIGTSHHILQKVSHPQMVVDAFEKLWDLLSAEECLVWKTGMP